MCQTDWNQIRSGSILFAKVIRVQDWQAKSFYKAPYYIIMFKGCSFKKLTHTYHMTWNISSKLHILLT